MASAASHSGWARATVDLEGRLIEADPFLLELQLEAGAALGERLVLPQLAAIARLAFRLGIPVARPALVASRDHDLDMWVHAVPIQDVVTLTVERWLRRSTASARLALAGRSGEILLPSQGEWAVDAQLRLTEMADDLADTLGAKAEEAVGQPLTKLVRLVEEADGAMPMLVAMASRSEFAGQRAVSRSGGGKLIISGQPVLGADGNFKGYRGAAKLEELAPPSAANEEALVAIDPGLDDALRTPIESIIAAADGIASRSDGPLRQDYAVYASDIAAAARHLASVISSIADQSGTPVSVVDAVALADEAVSLIDPQAVEKNVVLVREGLENLRAIGDHRSIVQIMVNLLGNAVRHTPVGSRVLISLHAGTDFASWSVIDQGPGIESHDQERIFGRFERGSEGGSSGLGLAIARRLARSMGGDITLVSTPGEGARFTLSLPLAP